MICLPLELNRQLSDHKQQQIKQHLRLCDLFLLTYTHLLISNYIIILLNFVILIHFFMDRQTFLTS